MHMAELAQTRDSFGVGAIMDQLTAPATHETAAPAPHPS